MNALNKHPFGAQCVFLLTAALCLPAKLSAENEPPASPEVTAAIQPFLDSYKLAGVIGIIADKTGRIHYRNVLGYADVEANKPMREDNVFWIASMTKMFAGASIMMLVEEARSAWRIRLPGLYRNSKSGWSWKRRTNRMSC